MSTQEGVEQPVTHGGKEYIEKTVEVLARTFIGDPVYTWLLHDLSVAKQESMLPRLLTGFFTQGALNGGVFLETADFGCCGLFMPPGKTIENPWTMISAGLVSFLWTVGLGCVKRSIVDYSGGVEPLMRKTLSKAEQKEHWYVLIMGTAIDARRQGHASRVLIYLQDKARKDGSPIWLEATTDLSRELYLKHGFELVGDVVLGRGAVGPDGLAKKKGEGITIWSMVWRP